jgi:hypothetical protein
LAVATELIAFVAILGVNDIGLPIAI